LSLLVLQGQLLVAILLDVILEGVLKLGLFFKGLSELGININIGNVAGVEIDTKVLELLVEVLDHLLSHLTLEIEHLRQPDTIDESSDTLVYLSIEKFIEPTSTQSVNKVLHLFLVLRHTEGKEQVDVDVSIVFCWAIVYL
jgi:hypothetical protein